VRRFRVEGCDFFPLVEKLHTPIQQHMHIDSLIGMRAKGRELGDLEDRGIEGDGIVFGHGAALLETQGLLNLKGTYFSPGRLSVSGGFREPPVVHGEITIQDRLGLGWGFGSGHPQLTNQSVLKGSPQPLDSTLGLRRACQDQGHPELF
jgi:hypothetical protein